MPHPVRARLGVGRDRLSTLQPWRALRRRTGPEQQLVPVLAGALERTDLADGYAYRFDPGVLKDVGEWIGIVAKCCQPLTLAVDS